MRARPELIGGPAAPTPTSCARVPAGSRRAAPKGLLCASRRTAAASRSRSRTARPAQSRPASARSRDRRARRDRLRNSLGEPTGAIRAESSRAATGCARPSESHFHSLLVVSQLELDPTAEMMRHVVAQVEAMSPRSLRAICVRKTTRPRSRPHCVSFDHAQPEASESARHDLVHPRDRERGDPFAESSRGTTRDVVERKRALVGHAVARVRTTSWVRPNRARRRNRQHRVQRRVAACRVVDQGRSPTACACWQSRDCVGPRAQRSPQPTSPRSSNIGRRRSCRPWRRPPSSRDEVSCLADHDRPYATHRAASRRQSEGVGELVHAERQTGPAPARCGRGSSRLQPPSRSGRLSSRRDSACVPDASRRPARRSSIASGSSRLAAACSGVQSLRPRCSTSAPARMSSPSSGAASSRSESTTPTSAGNRPAPRSSDRRPRRAAVRSSRTATS